MAWRLSVILDAFLYTTGFLRSLCTQNLMTLSWFTKTLLMLNDLYLVPTTHPAHYHVLLAVYMTLRRVYFLLTLECVFTGKLTYSTQNVYFVYKNKHPIGCLSPLNVHTIWINMVLFIIMNLKDRSCQYYGRSMIKWMYFMHHYLFNIDLIWYVIFHFVANSL